MNRPCKICGAPTIYLDSKLCDDCINIERHLRRYLKSEIGRHRFNEILSSVGRIQNCFIDKEKCQGINCSMWDNYDNRCFIKTMIAKITGVYNRKIKKHDTG